jgi:hypothetical protein
LPSSGTSDSHLGQVVPQSGHPHETVRSSSQL